MVRRKVGEWLLVLRLLLGAGIVIVISAGSVAVAVSCSTVKAVVSNTVMKVLVGCTVMSGIGRSCENWRSIGRSGSFQTTGVSNAAI
jgi:hypothetical protein